MDDRITLDELKRGTSGAAERLIQRHNPMLWRIARSVLRDDHDAEEVVQEAYLRAFSRIGEFRGHSTLGTWLARITINEALRRLEARRTAALAPFDHEAEIDHVARQTPSPEQMAAHAQIRRMVETAVDSLPMPYRLVFVMRVIDQMNIEETASALQIPAATVKTRLHRANQLLKDALGSHFSQALEGSFPFGGERCERLTRAVIAQLALPSLASPNFH